MITYPCCKINLGLNVVERRPDGYHNIETVFYPINLTDVLSIKKMDEGFPSDVACDLKTTGLPVEGDEHNNLVVRAYNLIARDYALPRIHAHLCKRIPTQAGLGGGSADAAYMIRLLDERFRLNMGNAEMERYASQLGADCAFFITAEPAFATGIGDQLAPADNAQGNLHGYWIALVKPPIAVSTQAAYANIIPKHPEKCCRDIVRQPIDTWKDELHNDFEDSVFPSHPILADIKQQLYAHGAVYAQMSGSGSTIFGIFREQPQGIDIRFPEAFTAVLKL